MLSLSAAAHAAIEVGASGQASYSLPLAVPPGISGMAPNLSLAYAEGGINGPLGVGWSLQGISSITRCGANRATDGVPRSVDFSAADKLCLDGQRLIQTDVAGSPLAFPQTNDSLGLVDDGSREYRTEKDSFARIRAYGSANNVIGDGPARFKVWTKSGQVYEYGLDPVARGAGGANALVLTQGLPISTATGQPVMVWAVRRVSDAVGNYINFKYTQRQVAWGSGPAAAGSAGDVGREWNIDEIQYTGKSFGAEPSVKVLFNYEDRPAFANAGVGSDRSEAYQFANKNVSIQRLTGIVSYINSPSSSARVGPNAIAVRSYKLAYENGAVTGRSRLLSLTECVGSATCLPATTFAYSGGSLPNFVANAAFGQGGLSTLKMSESTTRNYGVLTGDFNGDGRTDILRWSSNPAENVLYTSSGAGSFMLKTAFNLNGSGNTLFKPDGCYYSMVADFNGDGLSDILRVVKSGCAGSTTMYLSTGDGSFQAVATLPGINFSQKKASSTSAQANCTVQTDGSNPPVTEVPADMFGPSASGVSNSQAASTAPGTNASGFCTSYTRSEGKRFYVLDVNGDGIPDIVTTIAVGYTNWNSNWGSVPTEDRLCAGETGFQGICTQVFLGSPSGNFAATATNVSGKSLYSDPDGKSYIGNPYWRLPDQADINGDGLQDILALYTGRWRSTGDGGFVRSPVEDASQLCGTPIDFNGDGRTDCLRPSASAIEQSLSLSYGAASSGPLSQFNLNTAADILYGEDASRQNLGALVDDFDGDGRQDILRWGPAPADNGVYLSNGDGSFRSPRLDAGLSAIPRPLQSADGSTSFVVGDFLGTGALQILHIKDDPNGSGNTALFKRNQLYERVNGGPPVDVLVSVTGPTGLKSEVLTRQSLPNSSRYVSSRTVPAPIPPTSSIVDLRPPLYVVTSVSQDTGVGLLYTEYLYKDLKAERGGRGLLGFLEVRRQNKAPNGDNVITNVTQFEQRYPYIGVPAVSATYLASLDAITSSSKYLSRTTNSYCDTTSTPANSSGSNNSSPPVISSPGVSPAPCLTSAKVQRPYAYQTVEEGRDLLDKLLPTVTTTNTYNNFGDPLSIRVQTTGTVLDTVSQTFVKLTQNEYWPETTAGDSWILGRLQRASVTNTVPDSLPSISTAAGNSPHATDTSGGGSNGPKALAAVLSAIQQLLLND